MAQANPQLRINQLAKDFSLKSKDILEMLEKSGLDFLFGLSRQISRFPISTITLTVSSR